MYKYNSKYFNDHDWFKINSMYLRLATATKILGAKRAQLKNFMIEYDMIKHNDEKTIIESNNITYLDINDEKGILIITEQKAVKKYNIEYDSLYIHKQVISELKNNDKYKEVLQEIKLQPTQIKDIGGKK